MSARRDIRIARVVAVVPVRAFTEAKSRLAGVLSPRRRGQLVQSMLGRVLAALGQARRIDHVIVLTPDASLEVPEGVERLVDSGTGLNDAVRFAAESCAARFDAMLVIPADVPKVTAGEIDSLVDRARDSDVVVVPDRHGSGTNALWMRLPAALSPQFGVNSAIAHLESAHRAGLRAQRIEVAGFSHDVDVPDDLGGEPISAEQALLLADEDDLPALLARAESQTLAGFGLRVGYSRKVFIPLTKACRDVCHYCTFAAPLPRGAQMYLRPDEVLAIAEQGRRAGCDEALFTLGDQPEQRYAQARAELQELGFASTLDYLAHCAQIVFERTGLLPHLNPGVMTLEDVLRLRTVSASMGIMLESAAERLCERGGPHHRSPDKHPAVRLATLQAAGEAAVPFTTGLLIGIGETRRERVETMLAIRALHERYGHVQEIIIQNFRAKPGTRMAQHPEPTLDDLQWTIAMARVVFGATMSIQAPPNLSAGSLEALVRAGVNDWGGVSPVTPDHVNPEAPWPELERLAVETEAAGRRLVQRLPIGPSYACDPERWLDPALRTTVRQRVDAGGYVRGAEWVAGAGMPPPRSSAAIASRTRNIVSPPVAHALDRLRCGATPREADLVTLFAADGADFHAVVRAADELRRELVGDVVTYVVNRNINYTNICTYSCGFCAFAKGRSARALRGPGYDLDLAEIAARTKAAAERGATEVCLQGGIHPKYDGRTYLSIVRAVVEAAPQIHVHAFSPLEVLHGATTLGLGVRDYLTQLKEAGLRTLPGTAAEILCDDVRAELCSDKLSSAEWLGVMRDAHAVGLRSTSTIMFGHLESMHHWARHLLALRDLQSETGGFTEFVPLPFVHMEAPVWRRGRARNGPSYREAVLMHSVARLTFGALIPNIQVSWVKMAREGALAVLDAGANDLGGVLMDESITRAAGGVNGQEMTAVSMCAAIRSVGRAPRERTTLYGEVLRPPERPERALLNAASAERAGR